MQNVNLSSILDDICNVSVFSLKSEGLEYLWRQVGPDWGTFVSLTFLPSCISDVTNNFTFFTIPCVKKTCTNSHIPQLLLLHLIFTTLSELWKNMTNQPRSPDGDDSAACRTNHTWLFGEPSPPISFIQHFHIAIISYICHADLLIIWCYVSFRCHPSPTITSPCRQCKICVVLHFFTWFPMWPDDYRPQSAWNQRLLFIMTS